MIEDFAKLYNICPKKIKKDKGKLEMFNQQLFLFADLDGSNYVERNEFE